MSANDELQAHTCEKILQECGDIANNVVQSKVQDLTEQWKKSELESSQQYYVEYVDGRTGKANLIETPDFYGFYNNCSLQDKVKEVLAPVPSYEKYKCLETGIILSDSIIKNTEKENQQLKELLYSLKCCLTSENIEPQIRVEKSLAKIDNVIGEKK